MTDVIIWLLWTAALLGVGLVLAYRRIDLPTSTLTLGGALFVCSLFGSGWAISRDIDVNYMMAFEKIAPVQNGATHG